ncbi:MAG: transketolase family protein [Clostridiales bacterium]|jgi:transketolase|nr:transketolase family protein [Clostridiales bacterium]
MADVKKIATRESYGRFLEEYGRERKDLVVMCADLSGSNKTDYFEKAFPERFIECGISEQDMLAEAAGIAHSGHVVAASSFAIFAAGRSYEIIRNSIAYTNANVKVCATHGGITVGEDGASHQTFEDLALMRVIPGMTVINPADDLSAKALLRQIFETDGPAYARFSRSGLPVIYDEAKAREVKVGKALTLREGSDLAIIATGLMVSAALEAAEALADKGVQARVVDMHTIKPLDEEAIVKAAEECGFIVTAEEHSVIGGLGSAVAEVTSQKCPCRIAMVGQQDVFGESGKPAELLEKYGMTSLDIIRAAMAR